MRTTQSPLARTLGRCTAIVLIAALLALAGCGGGQPGATQSDPPAAGAQAPAGQTPAQGSKAGAPKPGGSLKFGLLRDPNGFDPHLAYGISNSSLQGSIYDTLIEYDEDGNFRGALAESWEQADATTFVFKLRKGVKFHDGSDFDAQDVLATLDRIKDPKTAAARKATVDQLDKVEAPDPFTVRLTLKKPDATFLHALASYHMFIVSADDVKNGFDFKTKTNGTGAFILASWEPQRRYVLKKNPNYWKKGLPYLDEFVQIPIGDDKARVNALRSGEVDFIEYVPWQEMDGLARDYDVYRHAALFNLVRLNSSKPPLDNKKVRQALNYVVDRTEVLNLAFGGQFRIIDGPLQPQGSPYYFRELEGTYKQDWEKAKALLKEAGYNSPGDVPPLELTVASIAVHSETGQVVQQQLQKFGLKVNWKTVDVATMTNNRTAGTYMLQVDGLSMAWPDPDYLRPYFHSKGTSHAAGAKFKNERLDQLLEQGAQVTNVEERKKIYLEAEKIILDEAPWIFLLWRPQAEAGARYVKGYKVLPAGLGSYNVNRWEYIWLDK